MCEVVPFRQTHVELGSARFFCGSCSLDILVVSCQSELFVYHSAVVVPSLNKLFIDIVIILYLFVYDFSLSFQAKGSQYILCREQARDYTRVCN